MSSANVGTGGNPTDPNYVSGDWLLGSITFDTTSLGSSTLAIQPSLDLGITRGSTVITNLYHYDSATIKVVPEPASVVLIAVGGLAMMAAVRRRRKV